MATPVRLAGRPKARPAAPEAAPDRFEAFVRELQTQLQNRLDATPVNSPEANALFDVFMSVQFAAKAARDAINQRG